MGLCGLGDGNNQPCPADDDLVPRLQDRTADAVSVDARSRTAAEPMSVEQRRFGGESGSEADRHERSLGP